MKVAFVGKGGSGKSSMSWLFVRWLQSEKEKILAIDADHNMDLTSLLSVPFNTDTPTIHKNHDYFREYVGLDEDRKWSRIVLEEDRELPTFAVFPADEYTKKVTVDIGNLTQLMIVGLGSEDVLFSDRCAHGHSAPLKYYLSLIQEGESNVIIDGVAGTDMLNFGLYCGVDVVVVVVESHQNSIKVAGQIAVVAERTDIPVRFVLNKPNNESVYLSEFKTKFKEKIIGEIGLDLGIASYCFENVSSETRHSIQTIWKNLRTLPCVNGLEKLRTFEKNKADRKQGK